MKRTLVILSAVAALLFFLQIRVSAQEPVTREVLAMDTFMTLTAYGSGAEEALEAAEQKILYLERLLSTEEPDSEISRLNASGSGTLSEDASYLLGRALEVSAMTGGAFDPLVYPLMKAWGFPDRAFQVPDPSAIDALLALLDPAQISFDPEDGSVQFSVPGMMLDLGGIAKGYASACLMELFRDYGIESALVNLGGNVQALGSKPDGTAWKVAIQDPEGRYPYIGVLSIRDRAVVTSGGYERFFEEDGKVYHHILDPKTGYPAEQGLLSVTVISRDGTLADALSTALFVLGMERGSEVWRDHAQLFDAVFLTEDHRLYATEGIADAFLQAEYPVTPIPETAS